LQFPFPPVAGKQRFGVVALTTQGLGENAPEKAKLEPEDFPGPLPSPAKAAEKQLSKSTVLTWQSQSKVDDFAKSPSAALRFIPALFATRDGKADLTG